MVKFRDMAVSLFALSLLASCSDPQPPGLDGAVDAAPGDIAAGDGSGTQDLSGDLPAGSEGGTDGTSNSCSGPGEDQSRTSDCTPDTFDVGGVTRGMIVCRPEPLPQGPLPLLLGFHGGGGNAGAWMNSNPWHELAARHGFVVVYMQGCRVGLDDCSKVSGSYLWTVGKAGTIIPGADDQAYILAALDRLEQVHALSVDSGCRFATGHSMGAMFSYSLLCDQPQLFNAIGPISGPPVDATCTPHGGTSIFHVHGEVDANLPFDTGCCSLAQKTQGSSAYLAGCAALPTCFNPLNWWPPVRTGAHPFADTTGLDALTTQGLGCGPSWQLINTSGKTTCHAYPGCSSGRAAQVCLVEGVGHSLKDLNAAFDIRGYLWSRFAAQAPRAP